MLGGRVLQHRQVDRLARRADEQAARHPVAAFAPARIEQPPFCQRQLVAAPGVGPQHGTLRLDAGPVFLGPQLLGVASDELLAREAGEVEEGRVRVDDAELQVLQQGRERRLPEDGDGLAHAGGGRRRRRGRHGAGRWAQRTAWRIACARRQVQGAMFRVEPAPRDRQHAAVREPHRRRRRGSGQADAGTLQPADRGRAERAFQLIERHARFARQPAQRGGVRQHHAAGRIEHHHGVREQVEELAPAGRIAPGCDGVHSRLWAAIAARNWARLISPTPIIRRSAASRNSNSDSLSAAFTTSM